MSVILDALNKAQEERKKVASRIKGRWVTHVPRPGRRLYYIVLGLALCVALVLAFLPFAQTTKPPKPGNGVVSPVASVPPPAVIPHQKESKAVGEPKVEPKPPVARDASAPGIVISLPKKRAGATAPRKGSVAGTEAVARAVPQGRTAGEVDGAQARIVVKKVDDERITMRYNDAVREAEKGNVEEAKQMYRSILAEEPNRVEVLNNLGVLAMKEGNTSEALAFFRKCLLYRQGYEKAYNNMGLVFLKDGDRKQAEEHFRKAIAIDRGGVEPYLNLVSLLRSEKRFDEAAKVLEVPLGRNMKEPALYLSFAIIKDEMGDYGEAVKYYRYYLSSGGKRDDKVIERVKFLEERQSAQSR